MVLGQWLGSTASSLIFLHSYGLESRLSERACTTHRSHTSLPLSFTHQQPTCSRILIQKRSPQPRVPAANCKRSSRAANIQAIKGDVVDMPTLSFISDNTSESMDAKCHTAHVDVKGRTSALQSEASTNAEDLEELCCRQVTAADIELEKMRWDFVLAKLKYEHEDNEKQRLHEERMEQIHQQAVKRSWKAKERERRDLQQEGRSCLETTRCSQCQPCKVQQVKLNPSGKRGSHKAPLCARLRLSSSVRGSGCWMPRDRHGTSPAAPRQPGTAPGASPGPLEQGKDTLEFSEFCMAHIRDERVIRAGNLSKQEITLLCPGDPVLEGSAHREQKYAAVIYIYPSPQCHQSAKYRANLTEEMVDGTAMPSIKLFTDITAWPVSLKHAIIYSQLFPIMIGYKGQAGTPPCLQERALQPRRRGSQRRVVGELSVLAPAPGSAIHLLEEHRHRSLQGSASRLINNSYADTATLEKNKGTLMMLLHIRHSPNQHQASSISLHQKASDGGDGGCYPPKIAIAPLLWRDACGLVITVLDPSLLRAQDVDMHTATQVEAGSLTAPGRGRMATRPHRAPGSPWKDVSASVTAGTAPAAEATRPHPEEHASPGLPAKHRQENLYPDGRPVAQGRSLCMLTSLKPLQISPATEYSSSEIHVRTAREALSVLSSITHSEKKSNLSQ
ncbi:Transmembrane protein 247 isoform X2 [Aix galericulata]|nr:Transmembrane protein 247 isoform X2 [Aix galericulata]